MNLNGNYHFQSSIFQNIAFLLSIFSNIAEQVFVSDVNGFKAHTFLVLSFMLTLMLLLAIFALTK